MSSSTLTVIHKYIRRELFDFSQRLFRTGPDHLPALLPALDDVARLLREHASMEEARLVPLLLRHDAAVVQNLERDHAELDHLLDGIVHALHALDPLAPDGESALAALQLDWNRFVALYLLHLDAEERSLFASIREEIPGVAQIAQSAAALGPQREEEFLLKLWAVLTPAERVAIEQARTRRPAMGLHELAASPDARASA